MSGSKPSLPQDVTFTKITKAQAASLEAAFTKSAALDGVAVSFKEEAEDGGTVTLSIRFSLLASKMAAPAPQAAMLKAAAIDASDTAVAVSRALPANLSASSFVGFDAARDCGRFAGQLHDAKVDFVARYYSHTQGKNLTASEAQLLNNSGIRLVSVWESQGDHVSFFTRLQGVDDATSAYNMAMQIGQPAGTPIYFAVDCDPVRSELNGTIIPYFQGVAAGFSTIGHGNPAYTAGVYGSGLVCEHLFQMGLVTHTWLANAMGWQGSKTYQNWNIRQHLPSDSYGLGFKVDPDEANPEYGGFTTASLTA